MSTEAFITKRFYSQIPADHGDLFLSVEISQNTFAYAITMDNFNRVVELCHVEITAMANSVYDPTETVRQLFNNYLLPQKKFSKVNVCFLNHDFTLAPSSYAENAGAKSLLSFSTGTTLIKRALQHTIKNIHFYYSIDPEMLAQIERNFPNASLRHAGAVNLSLFFSQHSLLNADILLSIGDKLVEIAAKRNGELLFYNVYNFTNNEDILYYLLFAMEQFGLDPLSTKLVISGERVSSDEFVKNIRKYIKYVSFAVHHPSVVLGGEVSDLPQHFYFTLLNQHICEL